VRLKMGLVGSVMRMCALLVCRAEYELADLCNACVARAAVRAAGRGPLPFLLAMGSWERRHWGSLPPWETFFKVFSLVGVLCA
jgi:hypothetical protein